MGLKAYDLVWVEGKSAAWRYPCEIEELKPFSPVVEEQPFDRFFKKASTTPTPSDGITSTTRPASVSSSSPVLVTTPRITGEPSGVPGKRIIYVNMPAGNTPAAPKEAPVTKPAETIPQEPAFRAASSFPTADLSSNRIPAVADNISHLDEGETFYGEVLPHRNARRKNRVLRPLLFSVGIFALLAAGMLIGLSLNKDGLNFKEGWNLLPKVVQTTPAATAPAPSATVSRTLPAAALTTQPPVTSSSEPNTDSLSSSNLADQPVTSSTPAQTVAAVEKPVSVKTGHPLYSGKEKTAAASNKTAQPASSKDSSAIISVVHKESPRSDEKQDNAEKETLRANIATMVSVGANTFTVGTFGGISDLQLTVSNRSPYPLDVVVVQVQYIQANKKVYKTENLYFRGIAAGSALMQEAPKSSRGVKVQYKVVMINSKEVGLSYSAI